MKHLKLLVILLVLTYLAFAACGNDSSNTNYSAGDTETYTADGVSFVMVYVPGGLTFPVGVNDNGDIDGNGSQDVSPTAAVINAYFIGETEVTYELWQKVYTWATDNSEDHNGNGTAGDDAYSFANAGVQGKDGGASTSNQHPVTTINWRDCMVWCNALTEWYNKNNGTSYECVYTYSSTIIRDSTNATACDGAVVGTTAKGFRLLSSNEYELAARYRDGALWTYGDHVSGDDSGACYDNGSILGGQEMSTVFGEYAVYTSNSGSMTAEVKSKTENALGLYDINGNVWEWNFDWSPSYIGTSRVARGGSWDDSAQYLRVGYWDYWQRDFEANFIGFRFARTQ